MVTWPNRLVLEKLPKKMSRIRLSAVMKQFYLENWALLLTLALALALVMSLWSVLAPFVAAFVLAYLMASPSRWRMRRSSARI